MLDSLLAPLDYARQALWNVPGKLAQGDVMGALPGLAGVGVGLASLPFLGPGAALLAGSAAGALGQGIGKSVDEERFAAPTGGDLMQALGVDPQSTEGHVGGMAAQVLGDPLTWATAGLGSQGIKGLRGAALARGPRYAGGLEKLAATGVEGAGEGQAALAALKESPELQRILQEMPEGSKFLGGNNALAFGTPEGDVLRLGREPSRLDIPEMLQPTRNSKIGDWRAERLPMAQDVGSPDLYRQQYGPLSKSLREQGLHPADLQPGNLGTYQGQPMLIDPGAAVPHPRALASGQQFARAPETLAADPGGMSNALLDAMGYDSWVRRQATGGGAGLPPWLSGMGLGVGSRATTSPYPDPVQAG